MFEQLYKPVAIRMLKCLFRNLCVVLLLLFSLIATSAFALDGVEVHTGQQVVLLELLNPGGIAVGRELRIALGDTGEVLDVEVVALRQLGAELEIEVVHRMSSRFILFEVPADGISQLRY